MQVESEAGNDPMPDQFNESEGVLKETAPAGRGAWASDVDLSLLEQSLSLTPWERMLANDDASNFAESLRAAMERRHAKS
jgi:hypothetical protein